MRIGDHTFMNIQQAVAWLLENNPLPFQSTANYAGNTEIALSSIIGPSPAKVRVGSIIFFADSKVSTVIGLTSNSFIVSDEYNDLVDDVVYVTNVAINGSGHLIVTLSNGTNIDAGLIKQVSSFSINGSQHLIVSYNDGSTTDLGEIFNGNVNIDGNFTANSIVEKMSGYSFSVGSDTNVTLEYVYVGAVKNGNKITLAVAMNLTNTTGTQSSQVNGGTFTLPHDVMTKLSTTLVGGATVLSIQKVQLYNSWSGSPIEETVFLEKFTLLDQIKINIQKLTDLVQGTKYFLRFETTFLLSENLAS